MLEMSLIVSDVLHLGCGRKKEPGSSGVDLVNFPDVDLVHDLEKFPYPLPDNHFNKVIVIDVLEHVDKIVQAMEEIHRVCREGAEVVITGSFAFGFRHPNGRKAILSLKREDSDTALGAEVARLARADAEVISSIRRIQAIARKDLSYGGLPDLATQRFFEITWFRARPGHESQFEAAAKPSAPPPDAPVAVDAVFTRGRSSGLTR